MSKLDVPTPEDWDTAARAARGVQIKNTFLTDPNHPKNSGEHANYYKATLRNGTTIECNDIIEALYMNFAEGNAFKAIWRKANARLGNEKTGHSALYDAQKIKWSGERLVKQETNKKQKW